MRALVAVDLRETSEALVDRAAAWAARFDAVLHVRTVSTLRGEAEAIAGAVEAAFVAQEWERRKNWERSQIEALAARVPEKNRGQAEVMEGAAWRRLVDASAAFDLLIVGTQRRDGLAHLFLGSVAERVVRAAKCPVLVIPDDTEPIDAASTLIVACPIDVEDPDMSAARLARGWIGKQVAFELVHALPHAPWLTREFQGKPAVRDHPEAERARSILDDLAAVEELGMSHSHVALATYDNPGSRIAEVAAELRADLVVMPTHGRRGPARLLLGSVTERVMRKATCPVLVTR